MPTDPATARTYAGHHFTHHTWPLHDLCRMIETGTILHNLFGARRPPGATGFNALTTEAARMITQALQDRFHASPVMLNDRQPATEVDSRGRYALINGNAVIAAAATWFDDRVYVPAKLFLPDEVARTDPMPTPSGVPVPHTCYSWLTDKGQQRTRDALHVNVEIGTLPSPEAETEMFVFVNTQLT